MIGYPAAEALGRTPRFLYEGTGEEAAYDRVVELLNNHLPVREHVTLRAKDGHLIHTVHNVTPNRFTADKALRNISSFTDVTDLVHAAASLREQASTDALTGLYNRRSGEAFLQARMREFRQAGGSVSVALFDIDHFKAVNDNFGHAVGDEVLIEVARTLAASVRGQDVAVRWGGEEFLLILPGATGEGARQSAERIRATIEGTSHARVGEVTISAGVTQARDGDDVEAMLARADGALYAAKRGGRNRVETA